MIFIPPCYLAWVRCDFCRVTAPTLGSFCFIFPTYAGPFCVSPISFHCLLGPVWGRRLSSLLPVRTVPGMVGTWCFSTVTITQLTYNNNNNSDDNSNNNNSNNRRWMNVTHFCQHSFVCQECGEEWTLTDIAVLAKDPSVGAVTLANLHFCCYNLSCWMGRRWQGRYRGLEQVMLAQALFCLFKLYLY